MERIMTNETFFNHLNRLINDLIKTSGLSKNQIIQDTGIDRSTFYQFLAGKRLPTFKQFGKILTILMKWNDAGFNPETIGRYTLSQADRDNLLVEYLTARDDDALLSYSQMARDFITTASTAQQRYEAGSATDDNPTVTTIREFVLRQADSDTKTLDFYVSEELIDKLHIGQFLFDLSRRHATIRQIVGIDTEKTAHNEAAETRIIMQNLAKALPGFAKNVDRYFLYKTVDSSAGKGNPLFPYYLLGDKELLLLDSTGSNAIVVTDATVLAAYHAQFDRRIASLTPVFISLENAMSLAQMLNERYQHFGDHSFLFVAERPCALQIITPEIVDKCVPATSPFNAFSKSYTAAVQRIKNFYGLMSPAGLTAFENDRTIREAGMAYHLDDDDMAQINANLANTLGPRMIIVPFSHYFISGWEMAIYDDNELILSLYNNTDCVIQIKSPGIVRAFYTYYNSMREIFQEQ